MWSHIGTCTSNSQCDKHDCWEILYRCKLANSRVRARFEITPCRWSQISPTRWGFEWYPGQFCRDSPPYYFLKRAKGLAALIASNFDGGHHLRHLRLLYEKMFCYLKKWNHTPFGHFDIFRSNFETQLISTQFSKFLPPHSHPIDIFWPVDIKFEWSLAAWGVLLCKAISCMKNISHCIFGDTKQSLK